MPTTIISLVLLLLFLSHLTFLSAQQPPELIYSRCFNDRGNYTNTSSYQSNFDTLISEITSNTEIDYGFYNFSHGQPPDRVSIIGLCRGDVKPDICRSCLQNASVLVPRSCPNRKEAMGGYGECFLRYSNRSILGGVMEDDVSHGLWYPIDASEPEKYEQLVSELLNQLRDQAAAGDSLRKYAAANQSASFQTVFGAVQCTPDLSHHDCLNCLLAAIGEVPSCCASKLGGRVITPSCNIRFENFAFYGSLLPEDSSPPPSSLPPPNSISTGNDKKSNKTVIAIVVPIAAIILLLLIFIFTYFRMRKPREAIQTKVAETDGKIESTESLQLDFETIRIATDNFADANKLGQGGFGPVYKGKLYNGEEVAVKRLSVNSGQGDREFKNEVTLVAKLQHRNLVRLLGFCLEKGERLLVYEFLPNKSLDYLLFDPRHRAQLNWVTRHKIIEGVARGILYLHEDSRLRIIHRDLKASNILLDGELNAKISDFGMARLFVGDQTQRNTNIIVGTYGYMAPEYVMNSQFSMKSDVFSFGVLILEIVSGKKNNNIFDEGNSQNLLGFAWKNWRVGTGSNTIDPLLNIGSSNEIMRCIHIGLLCVQENVAERPTMTSVALMLSSNSITLPLPSEPPFIINRSLPEMNYSSEYNSSEATRSIEGGGRNNVAVSINDASITELHPR